MTISLHPVDAALKPVPVLYLDVDGTVRPSINDLGHHVRGPKDVRIYPGVTRRMRAWRETGGRIAAVSNQGGIALGRVTYDTVAAGMAETDAQCYGMFDIMTWCPHHPAAADPEHARCWCRKPSAGAVARAAGLLQRCYPEERYPAHLGLFVGDRPEDQGCAEAAGLKFQRAAEWRAGL